MPGYHGFSGEYRKNHTELGARPPPKLVPVTVNNELNLELWKEAGNRNTCSEN